MNENLAPASCQGNGFLALMRRIADPMAGKKAQ
jgi:hypothetical protein